MPGRLECSLGHPGKSQTSLKSGRWINLDPFLKTYQGARQIASHQSNDWRSTALDSPPSNQVRPWVNSIPASWSPRNAGIQYRGVALHPDGRTMTRMRPAVSAANNQQFQCNTAWPSGINIAQQQSNMRQRQVQPYPAYIGCWLDWGNGRTWTLSGFPPRTPSPRRMVPATTRDLDTWTPIATAPPPPPRKAKANPFFSEAQPTCVLIHSSIELWRGRGYHESRDSSDCMEFPALIARMASIRWGAQNTG